MAYLGGGSSPVIRRLRKQNLIDVSQLIYSSDMSKHRVGVASKNPLPHISGFLPEHVEDKDRQATI